MTTLNRTSPFGSDPVPRVLGAAVEEMVAARGQADRLKPMFDKTPVPMALVNGRRRYVEVNLPLRLMFRLTASEMRGYELGDLTLPSRRPAVDAIWTRLLDTGCVAGSHEVAGPDGGRLQIAFYALGDALPGLHLFACVPDGWSEEELGGLDEGAEPQYSPLTRREREVLQLVADGLSGPGIAETLVVSRATIKSHLSSIYEKLGVSGRAAAVATGMRLGLIL